MSGAALTWFGWLVSQQPALADWEGFNRHYDHVAASTDARYVGQGPSQDTYDRWRRAGGVTKLPLVRHRRVLHKMFPGWTTERLFTHRPDTADWEPDPARGEETATERRDVIKLGGATFGSAVASYVLDQVVTGPGRMAAALSTGSVSAEYLNQLDHIADWLGVQATRVGTTQLMDEAVRQIAVVRELLSQRQRTADQVRLTRIVSKLGVVLGEATFNEGRYTDAANWYKTAWLAAQDAGDQYLADNALARRALVPAYTGKHRDVLALVTPRLEQPHLNATPAVAFLWAARARAHASLSEREPFRQAIDRAYAAFGDTTPARSLHSPTPERVAFYETTGYARLGDVPGALGAADRAQRMYGPEDILEPALVTFDKATALTRVGNLTDACQIAAETLTRQRDRYLCAVVISKAKEFDRMLGPATASRSRPVRDWRELLATTTG